MQLYMLMGILFLNAVTFVASQWDREESFAYYAVSNRTKQKHIHSAAFAGNRFTVSLTKEIAKKNHYNWAYSPFSTLLGLTIMSIAARRHTEQMMREKLGFQPSHLPRKVAFHEFIQRLGSYRGLDFELANAVFLPRTALDPNFVDTISMAFLSTVRQVDFSKRNETSVIINQWCAEHTRGHIKDIVEPADFNSTTSLVLVDAIHFTGAWLKNFDVNKTRDMPFYCADGKERPLKTMIGRHLLRYSEHAPTRSKIVELPFQSAGSTQNLSLFLILPQDKNGAAYLEENWDKINATELINNGKLSDVKIHLPKMSIGAEIDMIEPLKNMGMGNMFDPTHADFGGIFPSSDPYYDTVIHPYNTLSKYPGFYLNKIIQKAHIEIHEGNSTDESVNVSEYMVSSLYSLLTDSVEFIANHTFYGTVITTGVDPITVFTFRHTGIPDPSSLENLHLDVS